MDWPMTPSEQMAPEAPASRRRSAPPADVDASRDPIMTLRGAGVEADSRRVGRLVVGAGLVALTVLAIVLLAAGVQKNAQISSLRGRGVVVDATVSGCLGLMGGSGSNAAGYDCRGSFALDGRRYNEALPGSSLHAPGATLRIVTVPGDPSLVATIRDVATERPSSRVFVLPAILFGALGLIVTALVLKRRGSLTARPDSPAAAA
jgi:hypothetical protein